MTSLLAHILRFVPKTERGGIRLDESHAWEVAPTNDVERFLSALPLLAPEGAMAYFERTGESHVAAYLARVAVSPSVQVAVGTIWPRPDCYHVPLTSESMNNLVAFLKEQPAGFFCTHCHVYSNGRVILEWHDAFSTDPMRISRDIPTGVVEKFASAIGSSWT